MSFYAGSESSVYCDGCDKNVHDGDYTYCKACCEKDATESRDVWMDNRYETIRTVREYVDGEGLRHSTDWQRAMDGLVAWLERPLASMSHVRGK